MTVAAFAEQAMRHRFVDIDLVQHGICVLHGTCQHAKARKDGSPTDVGNTHLAHACGVHHNLVDFAHPSQKLLDPRPFEHVCVVPLPLNLYGHGEIVRRHQLMSEWVSDVLAIRPHSRLGLTLKLECNRVSSMSSTRHFRPLWRSAIGGSKGFGFPS